MAKKRKRPRTVAGKIPRPVAAKAKPRRVEPGAPEKSALPPVIARHGQGMRFLRGELMVDRDAGDPDNPARPISRAMVSTSHHRLRKLGSITIEESRAADRYGVLCEIERGPSASNLAASGGSPRTSSPTERQVAAAAKLRRMHGIWGERASMIVRWLVVENRSKEAIARALRQNDQRALGEIKAALGRAAEEWGIQAKPRRFGEIRVVAPARAPAGVGDAASSRK